MRLTRLLPLFAVLLLVSCFSAQAERPVDEPKASSPQATESAQERTLTTKYGEITLPIELALSVPQALVAIPKFDDFEGPWPGSWQEGGDLLWDRVDCNSHSSTHSASASGDPTCTMYYTDQFSWLVYGPFDLSGASAAGVDYWLDLDTEIYYDYNYAVASPDGIDYCGRASSGYSAGWMADSLDFADPGCPNLLGDPDVWFAFVFLSDYIFTYSGAWVDDVNIWCVGCDGDGVPNDNFSDAYVIPAKDYTNSQPTCGATTEPDEPTCGCGSIEDTVWYKFHETTTQPVVADTFGSDYDTELRVYSGPDPATFADLTCICCNDDAGGLQSECNFTAEAGTTYYFQIDGFGGDCGNLVFNLDEEEQGCWTGLPPAAAAAEHAPLEPSSEEGEDIAVREGTPPTATDEAVPGELIVKFSLTVSQGEGEAAIEREGAVLLRHLLVPGYALVHVPPGKEEQFLARLEANPKVELAEPNGIKRVTFVPNDEYYPYQWHMPQIQMEQAWDVANGSGVVVAVIDTGVAYEDYAGYVQAPDLAGTSFTGGCDFVNRDYHANDDDGHGTHVAGTVAQTTNNSLGVAGVAYGATIMPIKVLDNAGSGTDADVADGITWAADYGADVINLSLGGGYSSVVETAINYALSNGVVVVAATGNEDAPSLSCPACYLGVIAVGATDYNRNRAPYSNYGCGVGGHCLDVVAPGGDTSADLNGDTYADGVLQQTFEFACLGGPPDFTEFLYCFWQGTSMASPHVAGAAALLLDANPSLTSQQVGDCLRNTALDRGDPGYDLEYGYGLIQVRDALNACGPIVDSDDDGVPDESDNCPETYDTGNGDNDGDAVPGAQPPPGATWGGDACDADDDNDTVLDGDDVDPLNEFACQDLDADTCDDCSVLGQPDVSEDGTDTDSDGACDAGDPDDDNDFMLDTYEEAHACLDPLLADGMENADGDELRNYPEMVVGTDPCTSNPELALNSDGDGWSDGKEQYIGTDPLDDCPDDPSDDAWPPDLDMNAWANIADVYKFKFVFLSRLGDPDYDRRYDFDVNDWINIADVYLYKPIFLTRCTNPPTPGASFSVHFIDVGQGDAILIESSDVTILVDGGGASAQVENYLQAQAVDDIDLMVATHPHADHIGGLIDVLALYDVHEIWTNGETHTSQTYEDFAAAVAAESATERDVSRGYSTQMNGLEIDVLHPTSPLSGDLNENSVVLQVSCGEVSVLLTGDATTGSEASMQAAGVLGDVEVLKVGHHGSNTSTSAAFLSAITPEDAVISVGAGNTYGHPHQETLDRLAAAEVTVYRTDLDGTVVLTSDCATYSVEAAGS